MSNDSDDVSVLPVMKDDWVNTFSSLFLKTGIYDVSFSLVQLIHALLLQQCPFDRSLTQNAVSVFSKSVYTRKLILSYRFIWDRRGHGLVKVVLYWFEEKKFNLSNTYLENNQLVCLDWLVVRHRIIDFSGCSPSEQFAIWHEPSLMAGERRSLVYQRLVFIKRNEAYCLMQTRWKWSEEDKYGDVSFDWEELDTFVPCLLLSDGRASSTGWATVVNLRKKKLVYDSFTWHTLAIAT